MTKEPTVSKDRPASVAVIKSLTHAADVAIRRSKAPIAARLDYAAALQSMVTKFAELDEKLWSAE